MKRFFNNIKQRIIPTNALTRSLSLRLGLIIVIIVTVVFSLLFDYLFFRCKRYIQNAAFERATQLLDNTAEQINGIMDETELITNFMATTTPQHLHPDSLLVFTHRTVQQHAFLTGFAISMEPYYFPEMGRYFSAYSLRHRPSDALDSLSLANAPLPDSITTVREGPFEYFDAVWYKTPRILGKSCWIDAFDDYNEGTLSSPDIMTSYCCPMRDADGRYIGSITASLTLKWLSQVITDLKPYPNSSAIMIGRDGTYLVHPDTAKLFRESIFSDSAPESKRDIEAMGSKMLAGHSGMTETIVDGQPAFIFYRPMLRTGWSIAIVCPVSDVFARYNRLLTAVWIFIILGLALLMLFCYQTVRRAVQPLRQLDEQAKRIAEGHFDEPLPQSQRRDSVGRLQNSFIQMQQSLAVHMGELENLSASLQERGKVLRKAYAQAQDADRMKTTFLHYMTNQMTIPSDAIYRSIMTLCNNYRDISRQEVDHNVDTIQQQSNAIIGVLDRMLHTADNESGKERDDAKKEEEVTHG